MAFSPGRSRLKYWLTVRGMKQVDLSRRTGWSKQNPEKGWSPRMISFFCADASKMSPEAMYTISFILGIHMEEICEWDEED